MLSMEKEKEGKKRAKLPRLMEEGEGNETRQEQLCFGGGLGAKSSYIRREKARDGRKLPYKGLVCLGEKHLVGSSGAHTGRGKHGGEKSQKKGEPVLKGLPEEGKTGVLIVK